MITKDTKIADLSRFFHKVICSCGAIIGQRHNVDCDVARCRKCGDQAWISDCGKWKPDVWTGFWPGTIDAIRYGWFSKWDGPRWPEKGPRGKGWVECSIDDPDAGPDLNRVAIETFYDPVLQMRIPRSYSENFTADDYRALYREAGKKWGLES